ncbi:MAG TPA: FHIPEP family type III secretion protein [Chitinophagaceae bacterium]
MITLDKHNEENAPAGIFYHLVTLLFSAGEYEKILALNEKLSLFQLDQAALTEYYFVSARCCIQLNDFRRFTQDISNLESKELAKNISFLNAERAFFSHDMRTALQEINKMDPGKNEELRSIAVLYQWRNSLLHGIPVDGQISASLPDPAYKYFLFIIRLYQSIDKLSTDFIELNLGDILLRNFYAPDKYIVSAQGFIIKGKLQEAITAVHYAKSIIPDSSYLDFLLLQINAETLNNFSTVEKQIEDFIEAHGIEELKNYLKNITVTAKRENIETVIFKCLIQIKLNDTIDDVEVLKLIDQNKLKYTDYRQKSFLSSISAYVYERSGNVSNASDEYYDAGVEFYNNNNFPEAEKWFEKAYRLNPAFVKAGWYLCDSLYINSFTKTYPNIDEARVGKAIEIMNQCFKTLSDRNENLTANFSWVYLLMANLYERNGNTKGKDPNEEGRKAMTFIEFSLLNNTTNLARIKTATRLYSNIAMDMNAYALSEKASDLNADNKDLLEEFTRVVINRGDFNKAESLLSRLYELNPDNKEFYDGWKAFIQYIQSVDMPGLINSSIELLKNKLRKDDTDLWTHFLLMHCYWLNNNDAEFIEQANWIIGIEFNDSYNYKSSELAFAYFLKGNIDKAIEYNKISQEDTVNIAGVYLDSTCYLIAANKLNEATEVFEKLMALPVAKFEITNDIRYYSTILDKAKSVNSANIKSIDKLINDSLNGFIPRLRKKLETDNFDIDPISEIKNFLEKPAYKEHSWGRLALYMALFRWYIQQKNYAEALFYFNKVMMDPRSRIYSVTWDNAASSVSGSIDNIKSLPSVLKQVDEFGHKYSAHEVAQLLQDKLMDYLHDKLKTKNKISWQLPVLPIALELQNELIPPEVLETGDTSNWVLFSSYIPQLRSSIKNIYGIETPGIRVRLLDNSLANYGNAFNYQILFNEVPYVSGIVYNGYSFCSNATMEALNAIGVPYDAIMSSSFQLKSKGVWVKNVMLHILDDNKIDYWRESLRFVMWHLQAMIENNLPLFFGTQQIENLLNDWKKNGFEDLVNKLFNEDARNKKTRFGKLLHTLLEEKVPVTNALVILNYCLQSQLTSDDIYDDIQNLRNRLKEFFIQKIQNNAEAVIGLLPSLEKEISSWVCSDNKKIFMQSTPENVQDWLGHFRSFVSKEPSVEIITVQNKQSRRFIKKIIELEYPQLDIIEDFSGM